MICRRRPPYAKFIFPAAFVFAYLTLVGPSSAADVTATRLDGAATTGALREWDNQHVLIATPTGDQRLATDQLVSLHWPLQAGPADADKHSGLAELIDGSTLPFQAIEIKNANAVLTLVAPATSKGYPLMLPASQLASVRFRHLDGALATQWDEMRRLNTASDIIAVLKKDGKSLDYVEGVVGDVAADKIEFNLEGETQRVDRAKIAGVIYYRPDRRTKEEPRAIIQGRSGLHAYATHVELKDSRLELTMAAKARIRWPLEDISVADFSAGKLMYLSNLEPASVKWTPLVGLPPTATLAAEYGQPRRDKSAYGGPLALIMREGEGALPVGRSAEPNNVEANGSAGASPSLTTATRTFTKGLAFRSRTEIVYRLPVGFQRFIALAGIDPATSSSGNVRLVISGDDRVLLETEIAGDKPPQPIQLDIAGVKRLKFLIDFGQNLDTGDWLNLCEARIVK